MSNNKTTANGGEDDMFNQTVQVVDELYDIRDNYFPLDIHDKISKMIELSNSALQLLDSIPLENRQLPMQRGMYEYLRGKILDSTSQYNKEAEDHLSKAVKLNPSLGDAWLSLGNCIWKKGQMMAAKNCMMLGLQKGLNKKILCQLSMLERKMAQDLGGQEEFVEDSIRHAKEAVALDVTDGYTWYNLGNAFMYSFFVTGAWDLKELEQSLKAYQNAERDAKMKYNPDLSFNCATVNKYLENYERALSGFEAAASKDPGLNATLEIQNMVGLFDTMLGILSAQAEASRRNDRSKLALTLDAVKLNPPYRKATVDTLQEGVNKSVALVGMVLVFICNQNPTPLYYLLVDSNHRGYILSLYGSQAGTIKVDDQVTVLDPCYRRQDFAWKERHYQFDSVRVDFLEQLRVNGKALSPEQMAPTSIFAQHKP